MVYIYDRNLTDIVKLFCNVGGGSFNTLLLDLRSDAQDSCQHDRRCKLWSHNKIYECCCWMQLQITNCLMAWCTNPTRLQSLSVWRDHVTITVTTWEHMESVEELGTFKARSPSHSSAFMDFNAASSQTLLGMACRSTFLTSVFYQPPSSCNIY